MLFSRRSSFADGPPPQDILLDRSKRNPPHRWTPLYTGFLVWGTSKGDASATKASGTPTWDPLRIRAIFPGEVAGVARFGAMLAARGAAS